MPDCFTIDYDSRSVGDGKTYDQLTRIAKEPGRYLFAVDRRDIMIEREAKLNEIAKLVGTNVTVMLIHTPIGNGPGQSGNVRTNIEALPGTYQSGHLVAFITHAGLQSADHRAFSDWHLIIDETPSIFDRATLKTTVSRDLVASLFDLEPYGEFSKIIPKAKFSTRVVSGDSLAGPLGTLHARVIGGQCLVLTHLRDWLDLDRNSRWSWWSLWSLAGLTAFKSAVILAAGFDKSLTFELCRSRHPEIAWRRISSAPPRPSRERTLTVRYFAEAHVATRHLFGSKVGEGYIATIAGYLAKQPTDCIWTCNAAEKAAMQKRLADGYLTPRQAGSNSWAHINHAAIIYTSKPDLYERRLLTSLDVDPACVIETRERDTIYQFLGRTSLRDRQSNRDITVHVYDKEQAEAVARSFGVDPCLTVRLELVDLGFAHNVHGRSETSNLTEGQKADRKRELARLRKQKERAARKGLCSASRGSI